jgi:hypothetical protein
MSTVASTLPAARSASARALDLLRSTFIVLLHVALEAVQVHLPERAITLQPACYRLQAVRAELVETLPPHAFLLDQARQPQDPKVLGDGWTALVKCPGE